VHQRVHGHAAGHYVATWPHLGPVVLLLGYPAEELLILEDAGGLEAVHHLVQVRAARDQHLSFPGKARAGPEHFLPSEPAEDRGGDRGEQQYRRDELPHGASSTVPWNTSCTGPRRRIAVKPSPFFSALTPSSPPGVDTVQAPVACPRAMALSAAAVTPVPQLSVSASTPRS